MLVVMSVITDVLPKVYPGGHWQLLLLIRPGQGVLSQLTGVAVASLQGQAMAEPPLQRGGLRRPPETLGRVMGTSKLLERTILDCKTTRLTPDNRLSCRTLA